MYLQLDCKMLYMREAGRGEVCVKQYLCHSIENICTEIKFGKVFEKLRKHFVIKLINEAK